MNKKPEGLSPFIDHTLLKPEATHEQILHLCEEALKFEFFSVCVNSSYVSTCAQFLKNSNVKVCSVVGFPLGAMNTLAKAYETALAVKEGAHEIDMVLSIGALKSKNYDYVLADIQAVVQAARGATVKVIIETSLLNQEEKVLACQISERAGAHFVKTSTGFSGGGATLEDIELMKKSCGPEMKIKASGGIKSSKQAWSLIAAGAHRLGTSSGVTLVQNELSTEGY
ncbi:MAG TPA: deoxyribose-phosphate aldolase [Pseudobdellovibrionaceae bacterium]|nr:deoxyribose-phosphate aldolase [Pseudobdellovibrionaceae bacterium]